MNKITKVGVYIIFIAVITPLISFMTDPSSAYVWIFLFPVELVIGVIVLVVGLIVGSVSGSKDNELADTFKTE